MKRVTVARVEEIPPGDRKIVVPFRGRAGIGVFNVNGTFHALRNICPHKIGRSAQGASAVEPSADLPPSAQAGSVRYERDGEIIRCPWHLWEFEIATGPLLGRFPRSESRPIQLRSRTGISSSSTTTETRPTHPNEPVRGE